MSRLYARTAGWGSGKGCYEGTFVAHSLAMQGRDDMEGGDKVIMPQSAFRDVSRMRLPFPLTFEINNARKKRGPSSKGPSPPQQYCGVLEFSAPEDQVFLPFWMMKNLKVREGGRVSMKSIVKGSLPKGISCRIQPHLTEFIDVAATMDIRTMLEQAFRNYSVLTTGETICVMFFGTKYMLEIVETAPEPAISLYGSLDLEVDFAPPLDSATPGKIRPNGGSSSTATEVDDGAEPDRPESGSPANAADKAKAAQACKPQRRRSSGAKKAATGRAHGTGAQSPGRRRGGGSRAGQDPPTPPTTTPPRTPVDDSGQESTRGGLAATDLATTKAAVAGGGTGTAQAEHHWGGGQSLDGKTKVAAPTLAVAASEASATVEATPSMRRRAPTKFATRGTGCTFLGDGNAVDSLATTKETATAASYPTGGRTLSSGALLSSADAKANVVTETPKPSREELRRQRMAFFEAQQASKKAMEDAAATPRGSALDAIRIAKGKQK